MALRHAVHHRLRMESVTPLPYRSPVKLKRHKGGGLQTLSVAGRLLGPSPHMHVAWIFRTEGNIQHAHTVVHPDPLAEVHRNGKDNMLEPQHWGRGCCRDDA